jgi:hypothetical protein
MPNSRLAVLGFDVVISRPRRGSEASQPIFQSSFRAMAPPLRKTRLWVSVGFVVPDVVSKARTSKKFSGRVMSPPL